MRLLLDTHTLLWHFSASDSLRQAAKNLIDDPNNQIFISTASLWELTIKSTLGKLQIKAPADEMMLGYVKRGTSLLPITPDQALATASLPWLHRDPFDRMLITQARLENLTIITCDSMIQQYDVPYLW